MKKGAAGVLCSASDRNQKARFRKADTAGLDWGVGGGCVHDYKKTY